MEGIDLTGATVMGTAEAFFVVMPESVGLLVFGVALMAAAIISRKYFRKAEEGNSGDHSGK
ncbi:MAG: hypothetical protein IPM50_04810 [Acidobacteriota bacterium]|nr:MAG: hypothetical protein IPM50_04810 [Acidobacteriota bacterium]